MKENQRYKQFDLLAGLAGVSTLAVLLFECFFVFELYTRDWPVLDRLFPAPVTAPVAADQPSEGERVSKPLDPESSSTASEPNRPAAESPTDPEALDALIPVG